MLHTASLVHDDVIDGSDRRRGKSTINDMWGERKVKLWTALELGCFGGGRGAGGVYNKIELYSSQRKLFSQRLLKNINNMRIKTIEQQMYRV